MRHLLFASGCGFLVCLFGSSLAATGCALPAGWLVMKKDDPGKLRAALAKPSAPLEVGKPFGFDIAVCGGGAPEAIQVDAIMPRHRHGMNYQPKIVQTSDGRYRADAMLFHMPGLWRIRVKVYKDGVPVHFSLDMTVD